LSVSAVLDSPQRILHSLKNCRVEFCFGEILAFGLIDDARICGICSRVNELLASSNEVACRAIRKACFELDEPLFVRMNRPCDPPSAAIRVSVTATI
jgi:hypothetical protein